MQSIVDVSIEWRQLVAHLSKLITAFLLALPVGWEREKHEKSAGVRTFPLVAVGACAYVLVGMYTLSGSQSLARVIYGVVTGIGFIGGGAILKTGGSVSGTATAASIWNTGAIGTAVATSRLEIALALTVMNYAVLRLARPLKKDARE